MSRSRARTTFVILCLGRTGSNYLASLLNSHPEVTCFGELFTGPVAPPPAYRHHRHLEPRDYLSRRMAEADTPAVGFKLAWNNLRTHPEALDVLHEHELRVIRLVRENRLAKLVSVELSKATGRTGRNQGRYGEARVKIEPRDCIQRLEDFELEDRVLDELARPHRTIKVVYEALVEDPRIEHVQRFLGVEPAALESTTLKRRDRPLPEYVRNWKRLAAALRDTPYEHYLHDPAP